MILAFPYMFFSLDAGFRAIDLHTLTEASHSLGAGWLTTMRRVILPNVRVAALSGSFLALAIVMGEFTIASLAGFGTLPTYIQYVEETTGLPGRCGDDPQLRTDVGRYGGAPLRRTRPSRAPRTDRGHALMPFLELNGLRRSFGVGDRARRDRPPARAR